jgi:hypothetical protein
MTEEQRSKKYDELYIKATKVLDEFNPCKIENGTCARGRKHGLNFCCYGCNNLSDNGCKVQSLYCKTWICETAAKAMKEEYRTFNRLMAEIDDEARKYGMYIFRAGKTECLALQSTAKNCS